MNGLPVHASGISIIIAWASEVAAGDEQFEGVIQRRPCRTGRAGSAATSCPGPSPSSSDSSVRLPGVHPIHIAADGVDLPVVGDEEAGRGGRGLQDEKMLVAKRWWISARADSVSELVRSLVETADTAGRQHALADHRTGRDRRHVEAGVDPGMPHLAASSASGGSGSAYGWRAACARTPPGPAVLARPCDDRLADHRHGLGHDRRAEAGRCRWARRASRATAGPRPG